MKKFILLFLILSATCLCAYSQSVKASAQEVPQTTTAASVDGKAQSSTAAADAEQTVVAADDANDADENMSAEEKEHAKIQQMRDSEGLKNAREMQGKMRSVIVKLIGDSEVAKKILGYNFLGIYVGQYLIVLVIAVATFVFTKYLLGYIFKSLYKAFKHGDEENFASLLFKKIKKPITTCVAVIGIYFAAIALVAEAHTLTIVNRVTAVLFWASVFWLILTIFDVFFMLAENKIGGKSAAAASLLNFLRKVVKTIIIIIALLSILDNIGANVNAIIASLGIGGMALAFASQDTIANFFGSVSIIIDRPFVVGDWVKALSYEGNIETIGFRSTRLRTFSKTIVTIPNSILAKESIENFSKMPLRKVVDVIGVTYSTTPDQLEALIPEIRSTISSIEGVDKKYISAQFDKFGNSSLDIKIVYFTKRIDVDFYSTVRTRVNFALMKLVAAKGLSFAFPSQSIYIESAPKSLLKPHETK